MQTALATSNYFANQARQRSLPENPAHPNTWRRLQTSLVSAVRKFGRRPIATITRGEIEDSKSYRRATSEIREVTLRNDLHALSLLFQFGQKHNCCRSNPVREVEIPSDNDPRDVTM